MYSLVVKVLEAKNLIGKDCNGLSDPYVRVAIDNHQMEMEKTKSLKKTLNPVWNEQFSLFVF